MQIAKGVSKDNPPGPGGYPESKPTAPPADDAQLNPQSGDSSVADMEANREAALSVTFYHWVLSRL